MSLPQIDDAFIFSRTRPGPGSGTSTRMCLTLLSPGRTTPLMVGMTLPFWCRWPSAPSGRLTRRPAQLAADAAGCAGCGSNPADIVDQVGPARCIASEPSDGLLLGDLLFWMVDQPPASAAMMVG